MSLNQFQSYSNKKCATTSASTQPVETRLRLYNQYPGSYTHFKAMTDDLERIRNMGFKQVWINPFYMPCQSNSITPSKIGCPYAMQDHLKLNPAYGSSFRDVMKYTHRATELGLVPLFDLVARHVAIDHAFVKGSERLSRIGIDTKKWFKRHPNGNYQIKGMNENYLPITEDPWSDVVEFDYSDPNIRKEIFEHFWKPFIDFNIKKLGFRGARLDAVGQIPRVAHEMILPYIQKVCRETHQSDAYLVAETVGTAYLDKDIAAISQLVTHTMNSSFWTPSHEGRDGSLYTMWLENNNWYEKAKTKLQRAGAPTAGHSGSHDEDRYPHILKRMGLTDAQIKARMLEKIIISAFTSDGGHILAYGDEYGVHRRVDLFHPCIIDLQVERTFDLSEAISQINHLLSVLPKSLPLESVQRVLCEKNPNLVILLIHGNKLFNDPKYMIICDTRSEGEAVILNRSIINEWISANGRNKAVRLSDINSIYLLGSFKAEKELKPLVIEANEEQPAKEKRRRISHR